MPFINKAGCECLNESDEHGFDNCLRKDMTFLESDCDEQVIECLRLVDYQYLCLLLFLYHVSISWFYVSPSQMTSSSFPFYNFHFLWPLSFDHADWPHSFPLLCGLPGALGRITELLDWPHCWVEPLPLLSPFVHSSSGFHTLFIHSDEFIPEK